MKMEKKAKERWADLFNLAKQYRSMKPYANIVAAKQASTVPEDSLLLAVAPREQKIAYFMIMGTMTGKDGGFRMYPGEEGLNKLLLIRKSMKNNDKLNLDRIRALEYVMYICDKYDVPEDMQEIYDEIGIAFRGEGNYIGFDRRHEPYLESVPNPDEVECIITYMPGVIKGLKTYIAQKKKNPSFLIGEGNAYLCEQTADDSWTCRVAELKQKQFQLEKVPYGNRDQKRFLKKQKHNGAVWEFEHFSLPYPVTDDPAYAQPFYPYIAAIVDAAEGIVLKHETTGPEEGTDFYSHFLADAFLEHGIPRIIRVADQLMQTWIQDICDTCGIDVEIGFSDAMQSFIESTAGEISPAMVGLSNILAQAGINLPPEAEMSAMSLDEVAQYLDMELSKAVLKGKISAEELEEALDEIMGMMTHEGWEEDADWEDDDDWDDADDWDDDDDWEDDDWEDDVEWEDDDVSDRSGMPKPVQLDTIRKKLEAVAIYYHQPVKKPSLPKPEGGNYTTILDVVPETEAELPTCLSMVNRILLTEMAQKLDLKVSADSDTENLFCTIGDAIMDDRTRLEKILNRDEKKVLDKLVADALEEEEDFSPTDYDHSYDAICGIVKKGLMDVQYYVVGEVCYLILCPICYWDL